MDPEVKSRGIGRAIVEALELEAIEYRLHSIFAFTYVTGFFERVGFDEVERGALPLKAWKDCLRCPKFQSCDETAVLKYLVPEHLRHAHMELPEEESTFVALPVLRG